MQGATIRPVKTIPEAPDVRHTDLRVPFRKCRVGWWNIPMGPREQDGFAIEKTTLIVIGITMCS